MVKLPCYHYYRSSVIPVCIWIHLQSADLLLEDEKYSSSCQEHTTKHLCLWYLNRSYISEQFCFFSEENKTLINAIKFLKTWCTKTCDAICSGLFFSARGRWKFKDYLKNCLLKLVKPRKSWKCQWNSDKWVNESEFRFDKHSAG